MSTNARPPMPWEPEYGALCPHEAAPPSPEGHDAPPSATSRLERIAEQALAAGLPRLQKAAADYATQYLAAEEAGKDPGLVPTVTIITKGGQSLNVATARSSAWRTLFAGLGFDLAFALMGVLSVLTNFDLLHQAGWVALGALLAKTVVTTIATYFGHIVVAPSYARALASPPGAVALESP